MEIDKSLKLIFNEFQRAVTEVPLEVYYQTVSSDQYNSSGFQFNVKQPGTNALLDPDIWIRYKIVMRATNWPGNMFADVQGAADHINRWPRVSRAFALRGGNVVSRCLQNLAVMINNTSLNVQPYKWLDVLNRIYISNDQSEHEFSASGGRFDEGNHGNRAGNVAYNQQYFVNGGTANVDRFTGVAGNMGNNINIWRGPAANVVTAHANNVQGNLRTDYPIFYEFYNPGFERRMQRFMYNARTRYNDNTYETRVNTIDNDPDVGADLRDMWNGRQYTGSGNGGTRADSVYTIYVHERLPITIFKMYSTDGVFGVIPNINQLQIQGNFLTNFRENVFRSNAAWDEMTVNWDPTVISSSDAQLFLRWYTPPIHMAIPRELSIPFPKIASWSKAVTTKTWAAGANAELEFLEDTISEYNITLEAIPDLLLIYVKYAPFSYSILTPDDALMELSALTINIDNASGKLNQMTSLDLYLKWKKIIKHSDAKITGYDEFRKYMCVACLQPEDYGVRYGPGYSNQTVLGITATVRNWYNAPSSYGTVAGAVGQDQPEPLAGDNHMELFVTCIYNKNRFIIRSDGTANQDMLKVAADFNMVSPATAAPVKGVIAPATV